MRELVEELGVTVEVGERVGGDYPLKPGYVLHVYRATHRRAANPSRSRTTTPCAGSSRASGGACSWLAADRAVVEDARSAPGGLTPMRVAFATGSAWPQGWEDDHPVAAAVGAQWCVWSDPAVRWDEFDRVVIRSTWDYTKRRDEFVAWAHSVGAERLRNVPALIEANSVKTYLRDLGVPTVPTTFVEPGDPVPDARRRGRRQAGGVRRCS